MISLSLGINLGLLAQGRHRLACSAAKFHQPGPLANWLTSLFKQSKPVTGCPRWKALKNFGEHIQNLPLPLFKILFLWQLSEKAYHLDCERNKFIFIFAGLTAVGVEIILHCQNHKYDILWNYKCQKIYHEGSSL